MMKRMTIRLNSMTGFGKGQVEGPGVSIDVEVRAFNHRFLDFAFRAPSLYMPFEGDVRSLLSSKIERGKIEMLVNRKAAGGLAARPVLDRALFSSYLTLFDSVIEEFGSPDPEIRNRMAIEVLGRRDVVTVGEEAPNIEVERPLLFGAVERAVENLRSMREAEGGKLGADIALRVQRLFGIREKILRLTAETPTRYRERLLQRIQKLAPEVKIDEGRLAQEVAYIVERLDVTEELTRLESHLHQFETILQHPPNGRRLEFILQELGREINTISSKCQDATIQSLAIEAKADLEKMREQVQNVE